MAQSRKIHRNVLIRRLAATVLFCMYAVCMLGTSALVLGASSTAALARGGGHGFGGHGFHGGGFGGGFGFGFYPGYYGGFYPYDVDQTGCYVARQRVMTRHGWRIRRVDVCE
jgi:hypothetical protein